MTAEYYQEQIERLITAKGPQGVNALSREIGIPLSTMQKYMERQRYFVKNEQRKWDVPSNVVQLELAKAQGNFDNVIESQLTGIESMAELLTRNLRTTISLMRTQKTDHPVAGVDSGIHPQIMKLSEGIKKLEELFKANMSKVPAEYKELFKNFDLYSFVVYQGYNYLNGVASQEIGGLLLGESTTLSEEMVSLMKEYQHEA